MGALAMTGGTALQGISKLAGGIAQKRSMDSAAGQLNEEATQSVAGGIQAGLVAQKRANYVLSNAQARIAGGGLTTTGASAVRTQGMIVGQGEYNQRTAIYQGQDRAAELNYKAATMRSEGDAAQTSGLTQAAGAAVRGGTSFYSKYGSPFSMSSYSGLSRMFAPPIDPSSVTASDYSGALS